VDTFDAEGVHEAGTVADDEGAVGDNIRHGVITAFGDDFCAVSNSFAAFDLRGDGGVRFELTEEGVGVGVGVSVVERIRITDKHLRWRRAIDEAAAIGAPAGGVPKGVENFSSAGFIGGDIEDFFNAESVGLRARAVEIFFFYQLVSENAAGAFAEDNDFGGDFFFGEVVALRSAVVGNAFGANFRADNAPLGVFHKPRDGETGVDFRAFFFAELGEVLGEFCEGADAVAARLHHGGNPRDGDVRLFAEKHVERFFGHPRFDGDGGDFLFGEQTVETGGVYHGAGEGVVADAAALFDDGDAGEFPGLDAARFERAQ